jgi:hypothetical protein
VLVQPGKHDRDVRAYDRAVYRLALCVLAMVACVKSNTVQCEDGTVCPVGTVCVATGCATQAQLDACRDAADGTACIAVGVADGACRSGVCIELTCGDGYKAPAEMCDPGVTGDDGESTCQARGFHDEDVTVQCGVDCVWDTSPCSLYCGDNIVTAPYESCDGVAPAGTCLDYGFDRGILGCRPGLCVAGFDSCGTIGWNVGSSGVLTTSDAQTLGNELYVAGAVQDASGLAGIVR